MNDPNEFDARLAAHFGQEHSHVAGEGFVAATMRKVRAGRRRAEMMRLGLRVAALATAVAASPWLIAGAGRLNAALESSILPSMDLPGAWVLGALAAVVIVAMRVRRR